MARMAGGTITTQSVVEGAQLSGGARPRAQLFVALRCDRPLSPGSRHVLDGVDLVAIGRGDRDEPHARRDLAHGMRRLELQLPDGRVSKAHARLVHARGRWVLEDAGSKNGVALNGGRVREAILADGDVLEIGHTFLLFRDAAAPLAGPEDLRAAELGSATSPLATFVDDLAKSYAALARIAATAVPVLILGPSGTGKEVAARALHALSGRRGPFVAVNCGALVDSLLEAELFGHRRGAFSGATEDRPGLVRSADRGTLFLDEIAELPAPSQVAFLRVLQEQEVMPIGHSAAVKVDVRLCVATNADLAALVAAGRFREDLFARLSGLVVRLPPLAQRREDLGLLVAALLARLPRGPACTFTPAAVRRLFEHPWPRNIRELERCLQTALALSDDGAIGVEHLDRSLHATAPAPPAPPADDGLDAGHRAELAGLLAAHGGNIAAVARVMGKARTQIHRWVRRYGLRPEHYRRSDER
jgi:hypothetical protein